jgi:hypothetical protein
MRYKTGLLKMAIKFAPYKMIFWAVNIKLKGIAEVTDFSFDLETRKVYVQTQLYGEQEAIEVWLDDFAVYSDGEAYRFIIHQAQSNRPWLNNILAHITEKPWTIPDIPQLAAQMELISELLKPLTPAKKAD